MILRSQAGHMQLAIVIAASLATISPAQSQGACGKTETATDGETLQELADRCNTSSEAILSANPGLERDDIRPGKQLSMPAPDANADWLDRARKAVKDAGSRVEEAAKAAGRSVSDYLADEPDLNREILEFGDQLGLPGVSTSPERGANLVVNPAGAAGDEVEIEATGLPGNTEVTIGVKVSDVADDQVISQAKTDQAGRLDEIVKIPPEIKEADQVVFTVETVNGRIRLVSMPFEPDSLQ